MSGRARIGRGALVSVLVALCLGTVASAAGAASLSVSEKPNPAHPGGAYKTTIKGSYKQSELKGSPFLLAVIQYSSSSCAKTAKGEFKRTGANFFIHGTLGHSPFKITSTFTASKAGPRRVCAYLYPKVVSPTDTATPLARAGKAFNVV